jgi:hypothetical protein
MLFKNRYIGRVWHYRINNDYFKNGFSYKEIEAILNNLPKETVKKIKNLYYYCADELTNNKSVWIKKGWVNENNSKEYAMAAIINILQKDVKFNLIYNRKNLELALKNIKTLSKEEFDFIKNFY